MIDLLLAYISMDIQDRVRCNHFHILEKLLNDFAETVSI